MARFLSFAIHYPKPEHTSDLLGAMRSLAAAVEGTTGLLEMGAFMETERNRILAISVWESADAFRDAGARMQPVIASTPFDEWERQPRELFALPEAR